MENLGAPIIDLLRSIHLRLKNMMDIFFASYGITGVQAMVLQVLFSHEDLKMSQLAQQLGMTNSNLSAICQRLEKNGMLNRKRDPLDQRIIKINLTPKAKAMGEDIIAAMKKDDLPVFQNASEEDLKDIIRGLTKLDKLLTVEDAKEASSINLHAQAAHH